MKKMTMKIEGGHWKSKIENIHEHLHEVNRGNGKHRTKKGKGSYSRKNKHKERYDSSSDKRNAPFNL